MNISETTQVFSFNAKKEEEKKEREKEGKKTDKQKERTIQRTATLLPISQLFTVTFKLITSFITYVMLFCGASGTIPYYNI